jgi:hypothetical protein
MEPDQRTERDPRPFVILSKKPERSIGQLVFENLPQSTIIIREFIDAKISPRSRQESPSNLPTNHAIWAGMTRIDED